MIYDFLMILIILISFVKLIYFFKGYGWSLWFWKLTINPFYGFIPPRKANSLEKNYLLFESLVGVIAGGGFLFIATINK